MFGINSKTSIAGLLTIVALATFLGGCQTPAGDSKSSVVQGGALAQAELAFVGAFTTQQIKDRLDQALPLYELPLTEENYARAASTLVALREANGIPEMEILDYMVRSHVSGVKLSFPEAAGAAAAFLKAGSR